MVDLPVPMLPSILIRMTGRSEPFTTHVLSPRDDEARDLGNVLGEYEFIILGVAGITCTTLSFIGVGLCMCICSFMKNTSRILAIVSPQYFSFCCFFPFGVK